MIGINLNNVETANDFKKPTPGGYVMRIVTAENNETKQRIEMDLEFAEGEFAGYCKETKERAKFWPVSVNRPYTERALPFFKQFIETVQASNESTDGLVIGNFEDVDETKLVGLLVGVVVGDREYDGIDGVRKIGLDWYRAKFVPVEKIKAGNFSVPEMRTTTGMATTDAGTDLPPVTDGASKTAHFAPIKDDDIPF